METLVGKYERCYSCLQAYFDLGINPCRECEERYDRLSKLQLDPHRD